MLLVMGGSQGAGGINELVLESLPLFAREAADWQWFHITGKAQVEKVREAYAAHHLEALVHPFYTDMATAMGAAEAAISRAGASSLAELAAMRLPAVLVPYPTATDNHQFHNAHAFALSGAARLLEQKSATPEALLRGLRDFMAETIVRERTQAALGLWHTPDAAGRIAETILADVKPSTRSKSAKPMPSLEDAGYEPAFQSRSIL
jgi:UDP-N-acetylglucosamine--N-acetylmuramyl-(pentapeptide) pyrophosphoryl-undecaprenol N-acetylglucosamine transferase